MRTSRITILAVFLFTSLGLLCASRRNSRGDDSFGIRTASPRNGAKGLFSFSTPLSLFPPNAVISLTDDNTTFFSARPAAFGPQLPLNGLSGQLWVGSGFVDDGPRQGTIVMGGGGELGCSDVLGWNDGHAQVPTIVKMAKVASKDAAPSIDKKDKRGGETEADLDRAAASQLHSVQHHKIVNDGTDDYLHEAGTSQGGKANKGANWQPNTNSKHADIQSIQEGAEIAGKVVLLSRGGCGFLEKVKWVQRRGGIALIVGDDTKGGPLIQMYARGDTSNVTIPSIFTSYRTAQFLSLIIPSGSYAEDMIDDSGRAALKVQQPKKPKKSKKPVQKKQTAKRPQSSSPQAPLDTIKKGWFSWLSSLPEDKPTEGKDWVMVKEFKEEEDILKPKPKSELPKKPVKQKSGPAANDDFVIGVQDWRDPDLVDAPNTKVESAQGLKSKDKSPSRGGKKSPAENPAKDGSGNVDVEAGLLTRLFGEDEDESDAEENLELDVESTDDDQDIPNEHEGLWVTLAPAGAAVPFFDTLLVLVISPLMTLTVVYALLLLRSRIRRRRWRAPKSVVERLPVHTYHTIPPSTNHSRLPSPTSSSPTTPLLQSRPRPRSRTTSGLPEPGLLSRTNSDLLQARVPSRTEHREKPAGKSEWKKYMGRQVECVVCLEEYVDGVSRVMGLPCGHEFHVECITPWLTTRRRTCPICKGDVVRSLARASTPASSSSDSPSGRSSPRYELFRDDNSQDDLQAQIVETVNNSPSANLPVFGGANTNDIERGIVSPTPRRPASRQVGNTRSWRGMFQASGSGDTSSSSRSPDSTQDRSR